MDDMYLDCTCCSWQSAMKSLGRKKKNWASVCHGWHPFNLSTCCSWQSAMKSLGKNNAAALCHGRCALRFHMPFMTECHEEFGKEKEKLGSTVLCIACI